MTEIELSKIIIAQWSKRTGSDGFSGEISRDTTVGGVGQCPGLNAEDA